MAHSVQKVVQRCEDGENNGGSLGKIKLFFVNIELRIMVMPVTLILKKK